jgi:hypothetical protein
VASTNPRTLARVLKTAEEAVDSVVQSGGKLKWTKAGALFGRQSLQPKKHVDHLWQTVTDIHGESKETLITVGCLLKLTIARRPETWLSWVETTEDIDPDTGKKIKVTSYWVDDTFIFQQPSLKGSLDALRNKWGC